MITLTIDEKDAHLLRVTASYLLALASETVVTAEVANTVALVHNQLVDEVSGTDARITADMVRAYSVATGEPMLKAKHDLENGATVSKLEDGTILAVSLNGQTFTVEPSPTFNADELHQSETLGHLLKDDEAFTAHAQPDAAAVFGGKPEVAPSTAGVAPLPIAPEVTPAITSIPTPPAVPVPPVVTAASETASVVAAPSIHASGVELDVRGLPWDSRIHSREKTKKADGQWKNKRGVEDVLLAQVENELRGVMSVPAPLAPVADVIAPPAIVPPPPSPVVTANIASPSSAQPFPALMAKVTVAIAAHKLNQMQVVAIATQAGVPSLPSLLQRPDLIPNIEAAIDAQIMANEASGVPV